MPQHTDEAKARAEAKFTKQQERQREGAVALAAYRAENRAIDEKTARLKAARLAKEAEQAKADEVKAQEIAAAALTPRDAAAAFIAKRGTATKTAKPRAKKKAVAAS